MIVLNPADRNLLMRVLETEPDLSRKGNPRLRPLSLYSTELKNLKQVAAAVEREQAQRHLPGLRPGRRDREIA